MSRLNFGGALGGALEAGLTTYKVLDDSFKAKEKLELERRAQDRADTETAENSQIRQLSIRKGLKAEEDEAEASEIAVALQTGDLSKLSAATATRINKQLEEAGINNETVLPRLKSATILKPVIDSFTEQSKTWQQQAASGEGLQQADVVHLAQDPNFGGLKPHLRDLFFDKNRFNDKDGTPKLHRYEVNGKTVYGLVDQSDPVGDVIFHVPTGKTMVALNTKAIKTDAEGNPIKNADGSYQVDDSVQIPQGIATTGRSNSGDDPVSTLSLQELQAKTTELIKSGETIMNIRKKALESEYLRRSPVAREGVSKALVGKFENQAAWKEAESGPELQTLYQDPVMGKALQNVVALSKAFGGSPKEALTKGQAVIEKAQTLAADKQEGQAFISAFSGIMEAAGKNPTNPYSGMVDFFKENPAMIGRKGAVEAVKAAQTAIASDRKDRADQRRDELGWARVEAVAARSTGSGTSAETKAANLAKRDIAVRLRDAQRAYQQAVKGGDPAAINEAADNISYLNDQASQVGVPLANVPQRRETAEETEVLRQQATENLKAKRGTIGRFFNSSPSPKAVQAEMERIRKTGGAATQPPVAQMVSSHNQTARTDKPSVSAPTDAINHMPQPQQQAGKAFLRDNMVSINGQAYPLNPDGTVTISGRKYRVQ